MIAFKEATKEKWKKIRPNEDVTKLEAMLEMPEFAVLVQIAFEAGREWQSQHPTAQTDFPDYNAPKAA